MIKDILSNVGTILAQRGSSYDSNQERSMNRIVEAFNAIHKTNLTEEQGWNFMELLKMVRFFTANSDEVKQDSMVDGIAYGVLRGEAYGYTPQVEVEQQEPPVNPMPADLILGYGKNLSERDRIVRDIVNAYYSNHEYITSTKEDIKALEDGVSYFLDTGLILIKYFGVFYDEFNSFVERRLADE